MRQRLGHLAPFLHELRARSGRTLQEVAKDAGVTIQSVHRREYGPDGLGYDTILKVALACGASAEELETVRALDALDQGSLPLPQSATVAGVREAMRALGA